MWRFPQTLSAALLLLVILGLASSSALAAEPTTYEDAVAMAAKEGRPLLMDFFTEW